ncbi:XTP/dITP diphosphohydrolase [Sanguibacter gelidistatuariae]|uniref:XTP/dITP diphosphohydrolase n=1 Tax=Sanguibacter gelidistatuariae TaxID=1814289 RepID=A0A1G6QDJ6_9MICO|nr:MazG family protein [Sanguibacter gelidistatuariae]SDC90550.1 XTP/dITP diphosphohydrolase [Sanguibacter gelidistatuariae]
MTAAPDASVALAALIDVMDRLRSPGGCPWDAQQTHASLMKYTLEEAYELVEAVEQGDRPGIREELGDLLLQVVFNARVAQEHPDDPFDIGDVARDLTSKLVRRHPHVFAEETYVDDERLRASWDAIKQQEKRRTSVLEGIPLDLGALSRAQKVLVRAQRAGLVPVAEPVPDDARLAAASGTGSGAGAEVFDETRRTEAIGAGLLDLVRRALADGIDAEGALRAALRHVESDIAASERRLAEAAAPAEC